MKTRLGLAILVLALAGTAVRADIISLSVQHVFDTRVFDASDFQGSLFYLNNSVQGGHALAGQIGYGAYEIDTTGSIVNSLRSNQTLNRGFGGDTIGNPPIGAKSVVRLGDYYYAGTNNTAGIARFDAIGPNAWQPASLTLTNPFAASLTGSESLTTNGTLLFANEGNNNLQAALGGGGMDTVYAYNVVNNGATFSLNEAWKTDVGTSKRILGLSYYNGFVYGVDTGNGGTGQIWAFNASTGAATAIASYTDPRGGDATNFLYDPTSPSAGANGYEKNSGYGVIIRHAVGAANDELLVVGTGGYLSAFDMTGPTSVAVDGGGQPIERNFDIYADLLSANVLPPFPADLAAAGVAPGVALYGAAYDDASKTMWISYEAPGEAVDPDHFGRHIAVFQVTNPEPTSLALMGLGMLTLLRRRR